MLYRCLLIACLLMSVMGALVSPSPNLMELSARPWIYELQQKYGSASIQTLKDIPDKELVYYQKKGITDIYLLGVWSLGEYGLKHDRTDPGLLQGYSQILPDFTEADIIGSPFAVTEYIINPELGGESAIVDFRRRLNQLNMRLVLDFVPNHTAIDSRTITTNSDIYVHAPKDRQNDSSRYIPMNHIAYGRDLFGYVWTDTAQLNYWNPATVTARIRDIARVAKFADGIRCDMAMLAMNRIHSAIWGDELRANGFQPPAKEFWPQAIEYVRQRVNPDIYFMAEMYWGTAHELLELGFDYVYNKEGLYQALSPPLNNKADTVRNWFNSVGDDIYHQASFVSNHDEEPGALHWGRYPSDHPALANGAVAITTFTIPGIKFHWMGEWEGQRNKLDVHLRRRTSAPTDISISSMYSNLLDDVLSSRVIREGDFLGLDNAPTGDTDKVLAWAYKLNTTCVTIVVNLSDHDRASLPFYVQGIENFADDGVVNYIDIVSGHSYTKTVTEVKQNGNRIWAVLSEWQAQVFQYECSN